MKTLLISSYTLGEISRKDIAPPLNLLYIATILRDKGVKVALLDLNLVKPLNESLSDNARFEAIEAKVLEFKPDIVAFSCLTTAHFPFMRKASVLVKNLSLNIKIILGGVHATLFAKDILENCPEFDFLILGEGETQIASLVDAIENKTLVNLENIQSLAWRTASDKIVINARENYIENLDSIPMPAWDLIDFNDYYTDHSNWFNPKEHNIKISIPILATRSCPYDCNFCSAHKTMGRGFRKRSAKEVVNEMEFHVDNYGHRYFGFADDNLTLQKSYLLELCKEINKRKLDIQFESFNGYNLPSLDEEMVEALADAGCIYSILPIEHGSEWMRNKIIGKRLPNKQIFKVMKLYKKYKIQTRAMFIMGFPEDTAETLNETKKMIIDLEPDMADVFTLIPFPGTKVFRQVVDEKLLLINMDESSLWNGEIPLNTKGTEIYIKPYKMSLDDVYYWRKEFDNITAELLRKRTLKREQTK